MRLQSGARNRVTVFQGALKRTSRASAKLFLLVGNIHSCQGRGRCYLKTMELLEQLETHVTALLAKLDRLKAENTRFRAESSAAVAEKAVLEEENRKLHESLAKEETLRTEALKRIDVLLRRIQEHDSIE